MKVIYRLPQYVAICVTCIIAFLMLQDIRQAKADNFFDLMEAAGPIGNSDATILGINAYWFLMFVGLFLTVILAYLRKGLYDIKCLTSILVAVVFFLQAFLGAKLLYGIEVAINGKNLSAFDMGGQSLYGTIFISFAFIPILAKIIKIEVRKLYDYIAPFWLILLIFVRTGCFITGCCGADACWIGGVHLVLPVQLFEVTLDLVVLQIVFNYEKINSNYCNHEKKDGNAFFIMIGLYGIYRFLLEFIRNTDIVWMGLTYGQIYSIICVVIAINFISRKAKNNLKS